MRLFAATLATETNTFSPLPTSLEAYKESVFFRPGEHPTDAPRMCTAPLFVARRRAAAEGFTLIEGSCFAASPAGTTNRADYEFMRDEILGQLRAALPVDGVLLGLHGAMVAYGYDDVEGDIIERARAIVGRSCVIGVELDPHCHLTLKRMRPPTSSSSTRSIPTPTWSSGPRMCSTLVLRTIRKRDQAGHVALRLPADRQMYPTTLAADARASSTGSTAMEGKDGILSVSIVPLLSLCRCARTDRPHPGDRRRRQGQGGPAGDEHRRGVRRHARPTMPRVPRVATKGVGRGAWRATWRPVVMADPADNAGGGAPSDNTTILRHLIERNVGGRGGRADLGSDRGAAVLRCRARGRDVSAPLRRQDRARHRARRWTRR